VFTFLLLALASAELPTPDAPVTVYRLHPGIDAPVIAGAALAITVPTLLAEDIIRKRCPCDPSEINGFDRGAVGNHNAFADVTSDVTAVLAMTAPPLLDFLDIGAGDAFQVDAVIFAETLLVNGALVEIAKYAVQRPLPRTYAGDTSLINSPGGYRSFYSGHTSTVFAALTASAITLRLRYGERWWPWVVDGVVGSSVAVERVAAGRHFPTDVIVGALAGSLVGILVPTLHVKHSPVTIVPSTSGLAIAIHGL
jgi:membrane-associated phospholipid phosphatase